MHTSSELHVPIIMVTLLEPDDVVTDVGDGLAMDETLMAVGARVTSGGVDVGHGKKLDMGLTQVQNTE